MSNRITLEPTAFTDVRSGAVSYGYRLYDDMGQVYENTWDSIPDDDMQVLSLAAESENSDVLDYFDHLYEHKLGIYIGSTYYSWPEIQHIFS